MIYNMWEITPSERLQVVQGSTHLNLYYNSTKKMLDIYSSLPDCLKKHRSEMLCFLTNTARAIKLKASTIEVGRSYATFRLNKMHISSKKMAALQDKLEELGYLDLYRGGILQWDTMQRCNSYLKLNTSLTDLFSSVNIQDILTQREIILQDSVVIKDRVTKDIMSTRGVDGVQQVRDAVDALNVRLIASSFVIKDSNVVPPQYIRSFSTNLKTGGRYYEKGSKIQNQPIGIRKTLMIDNQETVELDYKALHASLVYESEYLVNPEAIDNWIKNNWNSVYDPYPSTLSCLSTDLDKIEFMQQFDPKYNPVRNLTKHALMVSLNASSGTQAQKSIIFEYKSECRAIEKGTKDTSTARYYGIVSPKVFPGSNVMNAVLDYNTPIAKYFYNDVGIRLQNVDSRIMQIVIDKIMSLDMEVGLSMHDGIIVKTKIKDKVKRYMKEAYKDVMGSDKFCYIEEK